MTCDEVFALFLAFMCRRSNKQFAAALCSYLFMLRDSIN